MQFIDYGIVLLYLVGTIAIGLKAERIARTFTPSDKKERSTLDRENFAENEPKEEKSLLNYFLGNRDLPWWVLGMSGMASSTDLAGTMVISALIYALGTKGLLIEIRGGVVLIMAFLMAFMGKWNRRARVLTMAEWMRFRFGTGRQGNAARIISAVATLLFSIGAMSYFSVAGGKFLGDFLGMDALIPDGLASLVGMDDRLIADRLASIALIFLTLLYTVASGFYGAVITDIFQGFLILVAVVYVSGVAFFTVNLPDTFSVAIPGATEPKTWSLSEWSSIFPSMTLDLPGEYAIFNLFGGVIFFYLLKTVIEGCSGSGGYMLQRYLAAKSDRDAGLLSLFWIILLSFRWPLVTAFAVLGIHYGLTKGTITDPERILATVITEYVPVGMKGLLIASFLAAAMSTFNAFINASAAYWVKDIYQAFLKPSASERELLWQGRLASVLVVVIGLALSFSIQSVNAIWGWLTTGLGVGLAIPLLLRWYWWRFNGYGFAVGTIAGMIAAIVAQLVILPSLPDIQYREYVLFIVPSLCSLAGCIIATLVTPPTEMAVMEHFYNVTRPFGFWGEVRQGIKPNLQAKIKAENQRDIFAAVLAVPWQLTLFMMGIIFIMKQWDSFKILALVFLLLSIGLYFTWFRHLSKEITVTEDRDLG